MRGRRRVLRRARRGQKYLQCRWGQRMPKELENNKYLSSQGRRVGMGATIPRVRKT